MIMTFTKEDTWDLGNDKAALYIILNYNPDYNHYRPPRMDLQINVPVFLLDTVPIENVNDIMYYGCWENTWPSNLI